MTTGVAEQTTCQNIFTRRNHGSMNAITKQAIRKLQKGWCLQQLHRSDTFRLLESPLSYHSFMNLLSSSPVTFFAFSPQISQYLHPRRKLVNLSKHDVLWWLVYICTLKKILMATLELTARSGEDGKKLVWVCTRDLMARLDYQTQKRPFQIAGALSRWIATAYK